MNLNISTLFFQRTLQRKLIFPCQVMDERHFRFSNFKGKYTCKASPLMMHIEHYPGCFINILLEHGLQNHDHELHGGVIVIVEQHFVEWWFLQRCPVGRLNFFLYF